MHIKHNKITKVLFYPLIVAGEWMGKHYPVQYMKIRYFFRFHRFVNLKHPTDLNEKILWLYFNTDTNEWSRLTDKLLVRDYVKEKGFEEILKEVYAVWDRLEDVQFDALPKSFVLKSNNGSGTCLIVSDKSQFHEKNALRLMKQWMVKDDFGYEYHYRKITNRLFAEEYLDACDSPSVVDYKFWCFNSIPSYVWVCTNRDASGCDTMIYDMNWNAYPNYLNVNQSYRKGDLLPKPSQFDRMKEIARKLSQSFPVVRVDLFEVNGKVYFGEMTFTSVGGMNSQYSKEFLLKAGSLITL